MEGLWKKEKREKWIKNNVEVSIYILEMKI